MYNSDPRRPPCVLLYGVGDMVPCECYDVGENVRVYPYATIPHILSERFLHWTMASTGPQPPKLPQGTQNRIWQSLVGLYTSQRWRVATWQRVVVRGGTQVKQNHKWMRQQLAPSSLLKHKVCWCFQQPDCSSSPSLQQYLRFSFSEWELALTAVFSLHSYGSRNCLTQRDLSSQLLNDLVFEAFKGIPLRFIRIFGIFV